MESTDKVVVKEVKTKRVGDVSDQRFLGNDLFKANVSVSKLACLLQVIFLAGGIDSDSETI